MRAPQGRDHRVWTHEALCTVRRRPRAARGEAIGVTIASLRALLYALARLLGDVQAVRRGTVGRRLVRRAAGKLTGRMFRRIFR